MNPTELAESGLAQMKQAIITLLRQHTKGLGNAEIAEALNLRSDYQGGSKDYLTWSILGLLLNEGKIERAGRKYIIRSDR